MAEVTSWLDGKYVVTLDATERQTLDLHMARNDLAGHDAFADLVERGILSIADEVIREEDEARGKPCTIPDMVGFTINRASSGPYACFNEADMRFVEAVMSMFLREVLRAVLYKKSHKEIHNVVEREDEGNGAGEHPFPVN